LFEEFREAETEQVDHQRENHSKRDLEDQGKKIDLWSIFLDSSKLYDALQGE
jgi:hypothetical protein